MAESILQKFQTLIITALSSANNFSYSLHIFSMHTLLQGNYPLQVLTKLCKLPVWESKLWSYMNWIYHDITDTQ